MRPDRDLVQLSRTLSSVDLQNRLYRASDRDIALALSYLSDGERLQILSVLGEARRKRIENELVFHARVVIKRHIYNAAMERILSLLKGGKASSGPRGYLKRYGNN